MTEQAVTKIVGAVYAAFATMLSGRRLSADERHAALCRRRRIRRRETNFKLDCRCHQTFGTHTVTERQPTITNQTNFSAAQSSGDPDECRQVGGPPPT